MIDRLGSVLALFVLQGAAIAAGLAMLLGVVRRADARYALALGALILMASLPVATFLRPSPALAFASSGPLRVVSGPSSVGGVAVATPFPPLVLLWSVGVGVLGLRLAGTLLFLERWRRRHARPASSADQSRLDTLARRLGLRQTVRLYLSDRLEVPSAWGVLRPIVVLPASLMTGLAPASVEGILLHELAHVRRHDYLVNLFQSVVETLLFYHPADGAVSSVVRRQREPLCDDLAVAALGDPAPYARALLQMEERRRAPRPALSAKEGNLMNRIARILLSRSAPRRVSPLPSIAALAVAAIALGGALRADAQAKVAPAPSRPAAVKPQRAKATPPTEARIRGTLKANAAATQRLLLARQRALRLQIALQIALQEAQIVARKNVIPAPGLTKAQEELARMRIEISKAALAAADADVRRRLAQPENGATYGKPGKGQHPTWDAKAYPQGVGVLTKTQVEDARAFAEAQRKLAGDARQRLFDSYLQELNRGQDNEKKVRANVQESSSLYQRQMEKGSNPLPSVKGKRSVPVKVEIVWISRSREKPPYIYSVDFNKTLKSSGYAVTYAYGGTSIDCEGVSFSKVVRDLAKAADLSVVIAPGDYRDVNLVLKGVTPQKALLVLCTAGDATYVMKDGVYYVTPRKV